jgi:hypothetical protein
MKVRKYFLSSAFLFGILTTAIAFARTGGQMPTGVLKPTSDPPSVHNMLIVGEETVYLSHLPRFQSKMSHRYQVILEVIFPKQESYMKDRQQHSMTKIYTLNPEKFVLPELVSSDLQHPPSIFV